MSIDLNFRPASYAQLSSTVLLVLSCGSGWGRAASAPRPTRFASRLHLAERLRTVMERLLSGQERAKKPYSTGNHRNRILWSILCKPEVVGLYPWAG